MNDLVKYIAKLIAPMGYQVRPKNGAALLRVAALERDNDSARAARKAFANPAPRPPVHSDLKTIQIYLRTCLQAQRIEKAAPRPGGRADDNALTCIMSLFRAIAHAREARPDLSITLTILDDRSDETYRQKINDRARGAGLHDAVIATTQTPGQGASLHEAFSRGRGENALIYCVEDDYLHEKDALIVMADFYAHLAGTTGQLPVLHPQEHCSLYASHHPSYIIAGPDRRWRSIHNATHTLFTHGHAIAAHWDCFENTKYVGHPKKRQKGSEKKTTNRLFTRIPAFSPIGPCAVHMQGDGFIPPFYDWRPLWAEATSFLSQAQN